MNATTLLGSLLVWSFSWWPPAEDPNRAAQRLLAEGRADAAVEQLGQALAHDPDSPLLAYNLGNAQYRARRYEAAVGTYARVMRQGHADPTLAARAAYNSGNALFRLAESAETERPQEALTKYAEAMAAFRRALGLVPNDADAKFNYEVAERRLEDLRQRLEEQAQRTPSPSPAPGGSDTSPSPTAAAEPESTPATGASNEPPASSEEDANAGTPHEAPSPGEQPAPTEGGARAAEESQQAESSPGEASVAEGEPVGSGEQNTGERAQARAVIDTARQEELSPSEFWRHNQPARVAEPLKDW